MTKDEQLIDLYLQGELEGDSLDRFNERIRADEAFRNEVALQSTLRKSVRRKQVAFWKKEWEEKERNRPTSWWPWLLGGLSLLTIASTFYFFNPIEIKITPKPPIINIPSSSDPDEEQGPSEETQDNGSETPEGSEESTPNEEEDKTTKRLPMASLDLSRQWNADEFPRARALKSADADQQQRWELSESDVSPETLSRIYFDLNDYIPSQKTSTKTIKLQLFNGFLLLRLGQYTKAEQSFRYILDSEAFELHDAARWYLSLALIKQNKATKARATLEEIANYEGGGHFKQSEAASLLEALQAYE